MLPKDPVMLLSYLNTQLRDHYDSLDELCAAMNLDKMYVVEKMQMIEYRYSGEVNKFI